MTIEDRPRLDAEQHAVLGPLVRIIEEAADEEPWALIGAAAAQLQGVAVSATNIEFITTDPAIRTLAGMLGVDASWERGARLAASRLKFQRGPVPVFVHANPTFHGAYDTLTPLEIPSLWGARTQIAFEGATVLATPVEWELLLAVVLGNASRSEAIRDYIARSGELDNRLLTRLMREGHVEHDTEEAVWALIGR